MIIIQGAVEDVDCLVKRNQRITTREIAEEMSLSIGSGHPILCERLCYCKVCMQWLPKHLTEELKIHCLSLSMQYHEMGLIPFKAIPFKDHCR